MIINLYLFGKWILNYCVFLLNEIPDQCFKLCHQLGHFLSIIFLPLSKLCLSKLDYLRLNKYTKKVEFK